MDTSRPLCWSLVVWAELCEMRRDVDFETAVMNCRHECVSVFQNSNRRPNPLIKGTGWVEAPQVPRILTNEWHQRKEWSDVVQERSGDSQQNGQKQWENPASSRTWPNPRHSIETLVNTDHIPKKRKVCDPRQVCGGTTVAAWGRQTQMVSVKPGQGQAKSASSSAKKVSIQQQRLFL